MSEKREKEKRAMGIKKEKKPEAQLQRPLRHRHTSVARFKNKKHTLGRLKWSTMLNNRNNRPDLCPRGTMTLEAYKIYLKNK